MAYEDLRNLILSCPMQLYKMYPPMDSTAHSIDSRHLVLILTWALGNPTMQVCWLGLPLGSITLGNTWMGKKKPLLLVWDYQTDILSVAGGRELPLFLLLSDLECCVHLD